MRRTLLTLSLLALAPALAHAAIIRIAEPEEILPHADLVVRGVVDHETGDVKVLAEWGETTDLPAIHVENLEIFGSYERPFGEGKKLPSMPTEAFLLLAVRDGRYWLVDTENPDWLPAHSAILYVGPSGMTYGYFQPINPGGLSLWPRKETAAAFAKRVAARLGARTEPLPRRPDLDGEDADAFYGLLDGWLDFYTRRVTEEPRGEDLDRLVDGLVDFARGSEGELRRRAIEALLLLARRPGPEEPPRLQSARRALVELLENLGADPFVQPCLDELRSDRLFASRRTAGRLLVRIGGPPLEKAKEILVQKIRNRGSRTSSRSYWALISMGFEDLAKEARGEK